MTATAPRRRGTHLRASDLQGASRLAIDATLGLTDLVENLHHTVLRAPGPLVTATTQPTGGITGLVYRSIRGVTRLVGGSLDALLGQVVAWAGPGSGVASAEREAVIAALNGVFGDHLAATANPLAIQMHLCHAGAPLPLDGASPAHASGRVLLLVHGLCMNPGQWLRNGHDHGAMLAAETGRTPLYLHYNSGLPIAANGQQLADLMQRLSEARPLPLQELVIVGHSMGGLVARSAVAQAMARGDTWPQRLTAMAFLGTPHHGAPLERGGHGIDVILGASPYTAAFARLGRLRSAGIADLRHGTVLDDDDAAARGTTRAQRRLPSRVPLPPGVACYAVAGLLGEEAGALHGRLLGDGLVPVASALGQHRTRSRDLQFDPARTFVAQGVGHLALLDSTAVAERLRAWLRTAA